MQKRTTPPTPFPLETVTLHLVPHYCFVPDFLKTKLKEIREYVEFDIGLDVISEGTMIQDKGKETLAEGL